MPFISNGNGHASAGPSKPRPTGASSTTPSSTSFPTVEDGVAESTEVWARDLRAVFEHAKERFGDVSWESEDGGERIWGHKAVIYARAPKAFKDRYFVTRPFSRSPTSMRSPSPHLLPPMFASRPTSPPSSFRGPSPRFGAGSSLSVNTATSEATVRAVDADGVLRLTHGDTPELFSAQLEWLYTGEGFGDVVEWISADDSGSGSGPGSGGSIRDSLGRRGNQADRRDKLGQDLTYMWRSKLYADVRIHLNPPDSVDSASEDSDDSTDSLSSTAIFTAHRFILASRSPYFASVLLNPSSFRPSTADIHLPTPPFTPAALHFCLGYIYAGHLDFSNRTFDLLTAFQIHRAAAYLQLDTLISEIETRIVHDFCHGLDRSKCHCRRCAARVPRVWRFAAAPDVGAVALAAKARRWVGRAWGECWGREIGTMDQVDKDAMIRDVIDGINAQTVISAFQQIAAVKARMENGMRAKGREAAPWVDGLESMLESVEAHARAVLVDEFGKLAEGDELWNVISGKGFSGDLLETVCNELVDAVGTAKNCVEAPRIYQALVSSILLRVDPDSLQAALPPRSAARQQIETAKDGVLAHIRRRWMQIRDSGGFLGLENWSLKEISDEIEVPIDDLVSVSLSPPKSTAKRTPAVISRTSATRPVSRVISLGETSSVRGSSVSSPRLTTAARSSAAQDVTPSQAEANGLRRLRLSSSASTSSVASNRSVAQRSTGSATPTPTPNVTGSGTSLGTNANSPLSRPQPRSPTAARQGTIVPVGSARTRANAVRGRATSPSPASRSTVRTTMSGPPKPLITRPTAQSSKAGPAAAGPSRPAPGPASGRPPSPGPSIASVRTARSVASTATSSKPSPDLPSSSKAPSVASVRTARTAAPASTASRTQSRLLPGRTAAPAGASPSDATSSRLRTTSAGTTTSVRSRVSALNKAAEIPVPPLPRRGVAAAGKDKLETPTSRLRTASSAAVPTVAPASVLGPARSRAGSVASVASTARSVTAPHKAATSTAASSRKLPNNDKAPAHTGMARPSGLHTVAPTSAKPREAMRPTKPAATSGNAKTSVAPSSKPSGDTISSRTRSMSAASTLSKSSLRPLPPPSAMPPLVPSHRSASASTDDAHEARTPRTSETSDPVIRREGSSSSDIASPTPPSYPHPHSAKLPPVTTMPRNVRKTSSGSTRSNTSTMRIHPASAFDPPPRPSKPAPPAQPAQSEITDGSKAFEGPGVALNVGIPCIVSLEKKRARFRANVKYIGHMRGSRGPWVGIETEDLDRFGVVTLPSGSKEGVHYFHLTPPQSDTYTLADADVRAARQRQLERIREGLGKKSKLVGLGLGLGLGLGPGIGAGGMGLHPSSAAMRSASPFVAEWAPVEGPRALFVRPSEVVFVLGAE